MTSLPLETLTLDLWKAWCFDPRDPRISAEVLAVVMGLRREVLAQIAKRQEAENKAGVRGNMLRYIAFVATGNESGDAQLGVDRMKGQVEELQAERASLVAHFEAIGLAVTEPLEACLAAVIRRMGEAEREVERLRGELAGASICPHEGEGRCPVIGSEDA